MVCVALEIDKSLEVCTGSATVAYTSIGENITFEKIVLDRVRIHFDGRTIQQHGPQRQLDPHRRQPDVDQM